MKVFTNDWMEQDTEVTCITITSVRTHQVVKDPTSVNIHPKYSTVARGTHHLKYKVLLRVLDVRVQFLTLNQLESSNRKLFSMPELNINIIVFIGNNNAYSTIGRTSSQ